MLKKNDKKPHSTRIDLAAENKATIITSHNQTLADLIDLSLITKHAHWNLRGKHFYPLHLLFDDLYATLIPLVDQVAERISTLGGYAEGRASHVGTSSGLQDFPDDTQDFTVLTALSDSFAQAANRNRAAMVVIAETGDEGSLDLLTEIQREVEKGLWFMEAHNV